MRDRPLQDPDAGGATGEVTVLGVHPDARRQGHGSRLLNAGVDLLREAGADAVTVWLLADDEATRAFASGSGFGPDGAYRDRVVSPDGDVLREVRLSASLLEGAIPGDPDEHARARRGVVSVDVHSPVPHAVVGRSCARPWSVGVASRHVRRELSAPWPSPRDWTSGRRRCSRW